jgi:hypothetical protein
MIGMGELDYECDLCKMPSRIRGVVNRSGLFTKSQATFSFNASIDSICRTMRLLDFQMCRSLVETSKLQPTPQYVQTVLVRRIRVSRIAASAS